MHTLFLISLNIKRDPPTVTTGTNNPPAALADDPAATEPIQPTDEHIRELLADESRYVAMRSPEAQVAQVERNLDALNKIDGASVRQMAEAIESAMGVQKNGRKYEPDPAATGSFDHETALLYDIAPHTLDDGSPGYRYTLVDKDGRSMTYDTSAGEMTKADLNAARIFDMARQNPQLKPLLDSVRKILDAKAGDITTEDTESTEKTESRR
ncbi:MAG: hypothetical protein GC164_01040 [Phycisphaera sp.]|nr:hypothetical protein [Phycisphaera sp.]